MKKLTDRQIAEYLHRSYIAVDGLWFVKVEERYDFDAALDVDAEVWKILPKIQARMIKSMTGSGSGLDELRECLQLKFDLEGYSVEITDHVPHKSFTVVIDECPWHELMKKSGREHLSHKVGSRICSIDYQTWAAEFGSSITFELRECLCGGDQQCTVAFRFTEHNGG